MVAGDGARTTDEKEGALCRLPRGNKSHRGLKDPPGTGDGEWAMGGKPFHNCFFAINK